MPLPPVGDCGQKLNQMLDSACEALGLKSPVTLLVGRPESSARGDGSFPWRLLLLATSCLGAGAYAWFRGADAVRGDARRAFDGMELFYREPLTMLDALLRRTPGTRKPASESRSSELELQQVQLQQHQLQQH